MASQVHAHDLSLDAPVSLAANGIKPHDGSNLHTDLVPSQISLNRHLSSHTLISPNKLNMHVSQFDATGLHYASGINNSPSHHVDAHEALKISITSPDISISDLSHKQACTSSFRKLKWEPHDYIQANKLIRASGTCNARGCRIPIPTDINHSFLENFIHDYHDPEVLDFTKFGWPLSTDTDPIQ